MSFSGDTFPDLTSFFPRDILYDLEGGLFVGFSADSHNQGFVA
jgi:hypothetical protein